jgi:general secretion pathway protein C
MSALGWLEDHKATQGLQAAFASHGPVVATGIVGALLALQAGYLVTLQNSGAPAPAAAGPPATAAVQPASGVQLGTIINAHLFGLANVPASQDAPLSAAQLVLAGVISRADPRQGMAIIGPSVAAAKLYAVGASLGSGLNLHSVYPDRVLLDRGGTLETLLLPKKLAATPAPVAAAPANTPGQRLATLVQNSDGGLLGGLVRAQPVFNAGKLSGYRIFPGGRTSVASFTQLGLRSGDMITGVNGSSLDDPSRAEQVLQTLSSASSATLSILRNGVAQEINVNLETVANDAERAAREAAGAQQRGGAFGAPLGAGRLPGLTLNPGGPAPLEPASTPQAPPPPVAD